MKNLRNITVTDPDTALEYYNGITFLARVVKGAPKFTVAAFVETGSYDDATPGEAHFYEHLPFGLSENFNDPVNSVFRYMTDHGGNVGAYTDFDHTAFFGQVVKGNEKQAILGVSDIACRSIIDDQRFSEEKKTILTEAAFNVMEHDIDMSRHVARVAFGNLLGPPIIGTVETINQICADGVRTFFDRNYSADRLIVAMEGDFDPAQVIEWAKEKFQLPFGPQANELKEISFQAQTETLPTSQEATRTFIVFPSWCPGRSTTERDILASKFLGRTLFDVSGPMMKKLRFEDRLIYGISVKYKEYRRTFSYDAVTFDTVPTNTAAAVAGFATIINQFVRNPDLKLFQTLKDNELSGARTACQREPEIGAWGIANEALSFGRANPKNNLISAIEAVTLDDVVAAAQRYLTGPNVSILYTGKILPDFPDHNRLAEMLGGVPIRSLESDARATSNATSATTARPVIR